MVKFLKEQYIRFMVWLGAAPPRGYEYLIRDEVNPDIPNQSGQTGKNKKALHYLQTSGGKWEASKTVSVFIISVIIGVLAVVADLLGIISFLKPAQTITQTISSEIYQTFNVITLIFERNGQPPPPSSSKLQTPSPIYTVTLISPSPTPRTPTPSTPTGGSSITGVSPTSTPPTSTPVPSTPVTPTSTPVPPTPTPVPPTPTPVPPTFTPVPPTNTPTPMPTNTPTATFTPTSTPVPPTATPTVPSLPSGLAPITAGNAAHVGPLSVFEDDMDSVGGLAFSPNGSMLASGSNDTLTRLWQVADGTVVRKLREQMGEQVVTVAFSPNGNILASGADDSTAQVYSVDGPPLHRLQGHTDMVTSVAFSPNSAILATGSRDSTVRLWRVSNGSLMHELTEHENIGNTEGIADLAFSPNGNTLATAGRGDHTVRLWNVGDESPRNTYDVQGIWSLAFSPNGTMLALGLQNNTIQLRRLSDWTLLHTFEGQNAHTDWVRTVAFSPDGTVLASGASSHHNDTEVRLWGVNERALLHRLSGHGSGVRKVVFSKDGKILASGSRDGTIRLWVVR